ncbi:MAG: MFS transporter [Armatimonadetes bacterium]|nr:MFS transporter [Armatimonadota bacterium]
MRHKPLLAVFFTVMFDMLSFGTVIPDVQLRAESLGARGVLAGLVLATFSVAQLVFAPLLGRWSDIAGRRRVLIVTCSLAAVSSVVYGFAHSLPTMFVSRALLGVAGANLGVAYAYVSDVTKPEERAGAMGRLGMAFGIGFMIGPPLGSLMIRLGHGDPLLLGLTSAAFAVVNLLFVSFFLEDAPPKDSEPEAFHGKGPVGKLLMALQTPGLGFLLVLFLLANFAFSNLESTYFRLAHDVFHIDQLQTSGVLVLVGATAAVFQGAFIPRLVRRYGEVNLMRIGYLVQAPALAVVPFAPVWIPQLLGAMGLGIGSGLSGPNLSSLISRAAPAAIVGGIFGVTQSLGAVARISGPIVGNALYETAPWLPYAFAGGAMLAPVVMSRLVRQPEAAAPRAVS